VCASCHTLQSLRRRVEVVRERESREMVLEMWHVVMRLDVEEEDEKVV